jgi:DNA-binding response OmpR family regulator
MAKRKKILVVEDESSVSDLIKLTLEDYYTVIQSYDGKDALEKVHNEKPDLVVLDIMLPEMDGYQVCNEIKNDPKMKKTTVLMLSAKSQERDVSDGLTLGADFYFTKPFDPIELLENIQSILPSK